jgi:predicted nucleic acid-binding protein
VIVVDTNVVARLVLHGTDSGTADRVLERDPSWIGPALLRSEIRNVLATGMRTRRISLAEARDAASRAENLVDVSDAGISTDTVLDLADRSGCTAYDCEFVSVAMELGVPFVTSDRQVLVAFPETAISPENFAAR